MYQSSKTPREDSPVSIIGAGIAGALQALLFAQAGHAVTLHERSDEAMMLSTSHWAGGMLAPYCEGEAAEPIISRLGLREQQRLPRAGDAGADDGNEGFPPRQFRTLVHPCPFAGMTRIRFKGSPRSRVLSEQNLSVRSLSSSSELPSEQG